VAKSINSLAKQSEKCTEMGKNGYRKAILKFTNRNITQVVSVYRKVLDE